MTNTTTESKSSRATVALAFSAVAVVIFVIAIVAGDGNDWLWPVAGILGGAGAVMGWTARPKAMIAAVMGGLVFAFILGWIIWAAATGNF